MTGRGRQAMAGGIGLLIGAAAVAIAGTAGGSAAPATGASDKAAMEAVVRDYILSHPEIIPEAMTRLRDRETGKLLDASRRQIETPFAGAWAGAKDGDVVLVEFFDYACGYCRAAVPDVDKLLATDPKLKIVFRELPILGSASDDAARASLAAAKADRFLGFHRRLYALGRPSTATIAQAGQAAGVRATVDGAASDVRAEIDRNLEVARSLGLTGTPSFVVGNRILNGAVGYDELRKAIAEARAGRG